MCGIVGVVSPSVVPQHVVERMRDSLAHRGPDHAGLWRSGDGTVTLGHRRLSIIDLDPRSNQPMVSHDGRFVVTFNGEIYNFREIRTSLERGGVAFHTNSDTEVILEAFRRWGTGALDSLSGMFALAIWDERERRLLCARDRAGEKPLHYALVNGTFLCASEIKALTEWPGFERRVDYDAVIDFLAFGSTSARVRRLIGCRSRSVRTAVRCSAQPFGTGRYRLRHTRRLLNQSESVRHSGARLTKWLLPTSPSARS